MSSTWRALAALYKAAVADGTLTGDPAIDAATVAASVPESERDVARALRELKSVMEPTQYRCASPNCPGYSYRASEHAHPADTCGAR